MPLALVALGRNALVAPDRSSFLLAKLLGADLLLILTGVPASAERVLDALVGTSGTVIQP
jgi:carbamate kinase